MSGNHQVTSDCSCSSGGMMEVSLAPEWERTFGGTMEICSLLSTSVVLLALLLNADH